MASIDPTIATTVGLTTIHISNTITLPTPQIFSIHNPRLVESTDEELTDMEGRLY